MSKSASSFRQRSLGWKSNAQRSELVVESALEALRRQLWELGGGTDAGLPLGGERKLVTVMFATSPVTRPWRRSSIRSERVTS